MRYQKEVTVFCSDCHKWIPEQKTEFIDISEDPCGKDILTFKCPHCKKQQQSHRVG